MQGGAPPAHDIFEWSPKWRATTKAALHMEIGLDQPPATRLPTQQVQGIHIVVREEDFKVALGISGSGDAEQR